MSVPPDGQIAVAFSTARVGASGQAVMTGRAEPRSKVSLLLEGQPLDKATASESGDWTIVLDHPLSPGAQLLGLRADRYGASMLSEDSLLVYVPLGGATPLVLAVRYGKASGFLQRPDDLPQSDLNLDSVDYDSTGRMVFAGRAAHRAAVRLYLDNQAIGDAAADAAGLWTFQPPDIAPGAYTLRLDQLGVQSIVVARIEAPFERADPMAKAEELLGGRDLAVEPGESLWRIARRIPDIGYQYTVLYRAGQDQLRDPNLIYPGQVFERAGAAKP